MKGQTNLKKTNSASDMTEDQKKDHWELDMQWDLGLDEKWEVGLDEDWDMLDEVWEK